RCKILRPGYENDAEAVHGGVCNYGDGLVCNGLRFEVYSGWLINANQPAPAQYTFPQMRLRETADKFPGPAAGCRFPRFRRPGRLLLNRSVRWQREDLPPDPALQNRLRENVLQNLPYLNPVQKGPQPGVLYLHPGACGAGVWTISIDL